MNTTYEQLPLFKELGSIVPGKLWRDHNSYVTAVDREETLSFSAQWAGWWYMLLLGRYDHLVLPKGYTLTSMTLMRSCRRWGVYLNVDSPDGTPLVAKYWDESRAKALRGLRFLIKGGELEWLRKQVK